MTAGTAHCPGCGKEYAGGLHRVFGLVELCTHCIAEGWIGCWRKTGFHEKSRANRAATGRAYVCSLCAMLHHTTGTNSPGPAVTRHRARLRTILISAGWTRNSTAFRAEDVHSGLPELVARARPSRTTDAAELNRKISASLTTQPGRPGRRRSASRDGRR